MDIPPYKSPWYLCNGHLETIWPTLFRKPARPAYRRERVATPDDDFLDLDWLQQGSRRLAVISHGLEGDSRRHYVIGMAKALAVAGWDVLAWNFRGCSGAINRQPRFTHNGSTGDLDTVVRHALATHPYAVVALVGFSMGGNLTLVYLGREPSKVPAAVKGAVCFSVPCNLVDTSLRLAEPGNALYMRRFMRLMGRRVRAQARQYPDQFPFAGYRKLKTFQDFDDRYTAPLHGFRDAMHYWQESSSCRYLAEVCRPAWIVNARNDPFLTPSCFPEPVDHGNPLVNLIAPLHGGHCGFVSAGMATPYWSEVIAARLLCGIS